MLKTLVSLFVLLSAVGLVLSTIVHLGALLGLPAPLGERSWMLHMGVFVVWLAAVIGVLSVSLTDFRGRRLVS